MSIRANSQMAIRRRKRIPRGGLAPWRECLALDFFKAFLPVLLARLWLEFSGWELFWIALMPTLGHAFSIFLRLRGGRALVTMFGVWAGLTLYEVPLVMGATAILATFLLKKDEYRTVAIPLALVPYLASAAPASG